MIENIQFNTDVVINIIVFYSTIVDAFELAESNVLIVVLDLYSRGSYTFLIIQ